MRGETLSEGEVIYEELQEGEALDVRDLEIGEMFEFYDERELPIFSIVRLPDEELKRKYFQETYKLVFKIRFSNGYEMLVPENFSFDFEKLLEAADGERKLEDILGKRKLEDILFEVYPRALLIQQDNNEHTTISWEKKMKYAKCPEIPRYPQKYLQSPEGKDFDFEFEAHGLSVYGITAQELGEGKHRFFNEDSVGARVMPDGKVRIVLGDGLSAIPRGEVAARVAVQAMLECDGGLEKAYKEALTHLVFLNLYVRTLPNQISDAWSTLTAVDIDPKRIKTLQLGDSPWLKIEQNKIFGAFRPPESIVDLMKRSEVDIYNSSVEELPIFQNGCLILASDGGISDLTEEDVLSVAPQGSPRQIVLAMAQKVADINMAGKKLWNFSGRNSYEHRALRDNATIIVVKRLEACEDDLSVIQDEVGQAVRGIS